MLDFLRSIDGVGRTVPREDGMRIRTERASRLGRRIRKLYDVLSALLSALLLRLQLADSGERRKPRRTGHLGVRGVRTRSVHLNCHGRARPNSE